jgi:hypothetical protein
MAVVLVIVIIVAALLVIGSGIWVAVGLGAALAALRAESSKTREHAQHDAC